MEDQENNIDESIRISHVTPEDAREVQELLYEVWLDTYPNHELGILVSDIEFRFENTFTEEALKQRADQITLTPKNELFLCAKDGKKIVGICRPVKYEDRNQLYTTYVLPEYQQQGIGTLLWKEAEKFLDPTRDTFVEVAVYNTSAIQFYKKLGFKDTGKRFEDEKFRMQSGSVIPEMVMIKKAKL